MANTRGKGYHKQPAQKPRDFDDCWGFDKYALKACMSMAGYDGSGSQLARLLGCSLRQAERRLKRGSFTRHDIAVLVYKLKLDGDQIKQTFFNGHYPGYIDAEPGQLTFGFQYTDLDEVKEAIEEQKKEESEE